MWSVITIDVHACKTVTQQFSNRKEYELPINELGYSCIILTWGLGASYNQCHSSAYVGQAHVMRIMSDSWLLDILLESSTPTEHSELITDERMLTLVANG